jgi:outer membrane receptor protein involved in Fe transport
LDQVNLSLGPTQQTLRPVGSHFLASYSDDNISPEVTLTWRPNSDNTIYAAFKTGYKSGGLSNPFLLSATATPKDVVFQPEKAKGFEIGYKATTDNGRLRFDINAYSYKFDDLQVVSADNSTPIIVFNVRNAAASKIKGVQGSVVWQATDEFRVNANFGYNDAKYRSFPNAQCFAQQTAAEGCVDVNPSPTAVLNAQDLTGKRLIRAPKLTYSIGGEYEAELISGWKTSLSASGTYSSKYQTTTDNAPGGIQNSYWLLNAAIKMGPEDGRYELAVIGRNLTDSYYKLQAFAWTGSSNRDQYVGFFNRPREVVVQGTLRF